MYVPREHQESIAETLAEYFHQGNMVSFAKGSAELYEDYDEFTADEIMERVKKKFLLKHLNISVRSSIIRDCEIRKG